MIEANALHSEQQLSCRGRSRGPFALEKRSFRHLRSIGKQPKFLPVESRDQQMPCIGAERRRALKCVSIAHVQHGFSRRDRKISRKFLVGGAHARNELRRARHFRRINPGQQRPWRAGGKNGIVNHKALVNTLATGKNRCVPWSIRRRRIDGIWSLLGQAGKLREREPERKETEKKSKTCSEHCAIPHYSTATLQKMVGGFVMFLLTWR